VATLLLMKQISIPLFSTLKIFFYYLYFTVFHVTSMLEMVNKYILMNIIQNYIAFLC